MVQTTSAKKRSIKPGGSIEKPIVSASDIAKAKEALKDEKAKKRANSNMMYYLQSKGQKDDYASMSVAERKHFFEVWFADKMKGGETASSSTKDIGSDKQSGSTFQWVSKHHLTTLLGKEKAEARIASNKMLTRPDSVTGLMDEWSLEYKLYTDGGSEMDIEKTNHRLDTVVSVVGEAAKADALEDWCAARIRDEGSSSSAPQVYIKQEPMEKESKDTKQRTDADKKLAKTVDSLTRNPRQILKVIGETVTTLKCMYQSTKENRYTQTLNEDIGKLLPKLKADFNAVESVVTASDPVAGSDDGEAVIRAIAERLELNYDKYNDLCEWHAKFSRDTCKKHKKT